MKYINFSIVIAIINCFLLDYSYAYDCSDIVAEEGEGLLNYLANINFTVPKGIDGQWTMEMKTDVPFTFIGGWGIWVKSEPEEGKVQFTSRLENNTLSEGDQISFRFRISWFTGNERPKVISLTWEGIQLCKESITDKLKPIIASRRRRNDESLNFSEKAYLRRVQYRKRYFVSL